MPRLPRKKISNIILEAAVTEPVVGTVNNSDTGLTLEQIDELIGKHTDCAGWCPGCEEALDCEQAWAQWDPVELCSEMQRAELEFTIDETLDDDPERDLLSPDGNALTVRCEILSPAEGVPPQLRDFLRELERLVKRTEQQLKAHPRKKTT
ncbi:hypothetical protein AUK40_02465 [Candidatus Wirthbacteria bacterium CG2_30_54_11]|uniref:Uncharacterized protein n=1 Tax=Candidatus Wirthbacteria bacterium CG2_30_54_11 TaxID=1817892 RepID=A0A1J5IZZ0_9BACT|nr:MAG: hypothetical protein AUK40_02465 [Candidatus Wirthbacteria bacterium CG2_30_54_11]